MSLIYASTVILFFEEESVIKLKKSYICFNTDTIHNGHLSIICEAHKKGKVIIGCLSDRAILDCNTFSTLSQDERVKLYQSLDYVDEVVIQDDVYYDDVIPKIKPDYVFHSDRWKEGKNKMIRNHLEKLLTSYGGELIDVPYINDDMIKNVESRLKKKLLMPEYRRKRLRRLIDLNHIIKVMEAHNGLTGMIVENTVVEVGNKLSQYEAIWISSLCDSTIKGKPDIELVDMTSRFKTISEITEVTTKPIIFDGDTGGLIEHLVYNIKTLERMGVSAVVIEDKIGLKRNSLFGTNANQIQDSIENFSAKIAAGKKAQLTEEFMIIARIESLILKKGMDDALNRARAYVKAGADGIMIHSCKKTPDEILTFCDNFRKDDKTTPIIVVPSSFNFITVDELAEHGVNVVIYANHLIRAAFPVMQRVAEGILCNHRSKEVDENIMSINEVITLID